MLHDAIEHSAIDTEFMPPWGAGEGRQSEPRWRTVDRALRQIPIVFADSRKFAEEWTYRFLATALADLGDAPGVQRTS